MVCRKQVFISVLMLCIAVAAKAQSVRDQINILSTQRAVQPAAIVYLQTSKPVFVAGEDLWFYAHVLDAVKFSPIDIDRTLYITLQEQTTDSTIWSEMYRINGGLSSGHVYLPQQLRPGIYLLKAFSAHSFVADSVCTAVAPVTIVPAVKDIQRAFHPRTLADSAPTQFGVFPEGGHLVAGLENTVAFKAVNRRGEPVAVSGTVFQDNQPLVLFSTRHAGMGKFNLSPKTNATYTIRLAGLDSVYAFPVVQPKGVAMQVVKQDKDSLRLVLRNSLGDVGKPIYLRLQTRGVVQAVAAVPAVDSIQISLPIAESLQGIAELTVFDHALKPLAERLVFLHPEQFLRIRIDSLHSEYRGKEKVTLKINTSDQNGKPVPAVLSMRVYDQLFDQSVSANNIYNYVLLTSQLRGRIYDPMHYFDSSSTGRLADLDLLLLTQGWRRYDSPALVITDSIHAQAVPSRAKTKPLANSSMLVFDYNKSATRIALTDENGKFTLAPDDLSIAPRIFVKYFSEQAYRIEIANPFHRITEIERLHATRYLYAKNDPASMVTAVDTFPLLQYASELGEVVVTAKGRGFGHTYLGYLDSVAKYEANFDFVGACGWLNCPACGRGTKPVENRVYSELKDSKKRQVNSHPFSFTSEDMRLEAYHYPTFTEAELLEKFKMQITKGYYTSRRFYEPDYDKESPEQPDLRNTLVWKPQIITDQAGDATIHFFTSDIKAGFKVIIEGVSGDGALGVHTVRFYVR